MDEVALSSGALLAPPPPRTAPPPPTAAPPTQPPATPPPLVELIQTETAYVDALDALCDIASRIGELGLLSRDDERAIFSNCETLRGINRMLLADLEANATVSGAAEAFLKFAPFFKAYSSYCADYLAGQARLQKLRSRGDGYSSPLEAALQDAERRAGQGVHSLLIKPVQRVCKWPLLFRELLKAVPPEDADRAALEGAAAAVEQVAATINERVREMQGMMPLVRLSETLNAPELLAPMRSLLLSVDCMVGGSEGRRGFEGRLWLCSDLVLLGKLRTHGAWIEPWADKESFSCVHPLPLS